MSEPWWMNHNGWAGVLRMIFALFWGKDLRTWPQYADTLIYTLSATLERFYDDGKVPR